MGQVCGLNESQYLAFERTCGIMLLLWTPEALSRTASHQENAVLMTSSGTRIVVWIRVGLDVLLERNDGNCSLSLKNKCTVNVIALII